MSIRKYIYEKRINSQIPFTLFKQLLMPFYLVIFTLLLTIPAIAQEHPPKPITVISVANLDFLRFGTFIQNGTLGTIVVDPEGFRNVYSSCIDPHINSGVSAAQFEVTSLPGTLINLQFTPSTLDRIGGTITPLALDNFTSIPNSPFVTTGEKMIVKVGGTLTVQSLAANPSGNYSGTFTVTFIQQ